MVFSSALFFAGNFNSLLSALGAHPVPWMEVALPAGISFFTFQKLSYDDIYHNQMDAVLLARGACILLLLSICFYEEPYIRSYLGLDFQGEESIAGNVAMLQTISDSLKANGSRLLFVLSSGKGSFLPENFPRPTTPCPDARVTTKPTGNTCCNPPFPPSTSNLTLYYFKEVQTLDGQTYPLKAVEKQRPEIEKQDLILIFITEYNIGAC